MKQLLILTVLFFCLAWLPSSALANENLPAGFSSAPLWLSKTELTEGDSVTILTPLYNSSTKKISGDVVFTVDEKTIGTASFELGPGEAKIVSVIWKETAGTHSVKARIENTIDDAKQAAALSGSETTAISISVASAPPAPAAVQALSSVAAVAESSASAAAPVVASVAGAVIDKTEEIRKAAVASLENSLTGTDSKAAANSSSGSGAVLGVQTYRAPQLGGDKALAAAGAAPASSGWVRMLQQILLFIVSYTWVFYPLLLIILLGLLYLVAKAVSRKKPRRA